VRAVILAAGRGGRLSGVIGERPKCLARIGDLTLLERQIDALRGAGIERITVVGGYAIDQVRRACDSGVDIVNNARYGSTNSLYSLWLTRDLLTEGFVVLNCDVLFHPRLLDDLLSARCDDALLVASRGSAQEYGEEEMKVRIRRGLVTAIAKSLPDEDSDAENIGIARFGAAGARALVEQLDRLVTAGAVRDWLPRAFHELCAVRPLHAIDSRGLPWIEIDFPEDYWRACSEVLPAIEAEKTTLAVTTAAAASGRALRHV
jgi:choline kinase